LLGEIDEGCDLESRFEVSSRCGLRFWRRQAAVHWSPDDRTRIVAETSAAGAKVSDVAPKHGTAPSLSARRREARTKELASLWSGFGSSSFRRPMSNSRAAESAGRIAAAFDSICSEEDRRD
jgi:hypothetical protein